MKNTTIAPRALLLAILLPASCLLQPVPHAATLVDGVLIPDDLMNLARKAISLNSPEDALKRPDNVYTRHPYYNQLISKFDFKTLNEDAAKMMVKTFTRQEIEALVRFQSSPEGKSIGLKMPGYQAIIGAIIQNQLNAAVQGQVLTEGMAAKGIIPVSTTKPVMPYTPPTSPKPAPVPPAIPQGQGGSPIGK